MQECRQVLFFTLNREDFSFVIHLDRQPRTSRRREAQTGSRARSGSRSERTLDAVEHSRTLMEWWPFLIFHRGGLRIKVINNNKARKRLQALVSWLERNGYDEAAGSLREGMEETLTVVKLALPELLRKSLATTNAIENLNGTIRRVSRNVKRWKSPSMIRRWTALGVVTAEKKFHRIKGYRHMGALVHALRSKQKSLDSDEVAA